MSSDESEIEMRSALPAKSTKKTPRSPSEDVLNSNQIKKTTKIMIHEALTELKTRKGVSVYAIKKYITEKYNLDLDKTKYLIKKQIKSGVADGSIVQMKGIGASGSFKLAPVKETKKKQKKSPSKKSTEKLKKSSDMSKKPSDKTKKIAEKMKNATEKLKKPSKMEKSMEKDKSMEKVVKPKSKDTENKVAKKKNEGANKKMNTKGKKKTSEVSEKKVKAKVRIAKEGHTPAKKKAIMIKRKSIGSIIKPPKMRPKARD